MILRKPYAFLIKHFKLIHLILTTLTGYIIYRAYDIMIFFNNYILNDYTGTFYDGFYHEYISLSLYLAIILILLGLFGILLLFINKKKPAKAYIISIIYFIIYIIYLNVIKNAMVGLESAVLTAQSARVFRDLSFIFIIILIGFLIMFFIRGFGFNIHKFNFEKDLKELEITSGDNEEVELTIKSDGFKLKRNIRRFIREFTYYIKENKFIFIIICIALSIGIVVIVYKGLPEIINERHKQNDLFYVNGLTLNVEDSIITNLDYRGNVIIEDGYYVVARIRIENNSVYDQTIDYNMFRLTLDDRFEYPVIDQSIYFIDYASNNTKNTIKAETNKVYAIAFKISEKDIKKNYQLKISNGYAFSKRLQIGKFHFVTITPTIINKIVKEKTVNLNEEISFSNSYLENTKFMVSKMEIADRYIYDYEECIKKKCENYKDIISVDYGKSNNTLLILDYSYEIDENIPFIYTSKNVGNFINYFTSIVYGSEGNEKELPIKNVTPNNLKNKIVVEVSSKVKSDVPMHLKITIRNKEYRIKLK